MEGVRGLFSAVVGPLHTCTGPSAQTPLDLPADLAANRAPHRSQETTGQKNRAAVAQGNQLTGPPGQATVAEGPFSRERDARDKWRWIKRIRSDYKPRTVNLNGPDGKPTSFSKQADTFAKHLAEVQWARTQDPPTGSQTTVL